MTGNHLIPKAALRGSNKNQSTGSKWFSYFEAIILSTGPEHWKSHHFPKLIHAPFETIEVGNFLALLPPTCLGWGWPTQEPLLSLLLETGPSTQAKEDFQQAALLVWETVFRQRAKRRLYWRKSREWIFKGCSENYGYFAFSLYVWDSNHTSCAPERVPFLKWIFLGSCCGNMKHLNPDNDDIS